ncbi:Cytochrome P450 CYP2 subfamily [Handroanthus impetiginosus]|uniref:Cytochrome P450 CYP2 subfamily n=1 Tax=Handroanthus impetiginosus TaxID=429701 RepID=A0A2G9GRI5_9LAMI|nr:Cytochrome P450 CYP2 subfamily [Handroanthus impetiginosus]
MENQTILIIIVALCFITTIIIKNWPKIIIKKKRTQYPDLPPGPKGWPIVGCIPQMMKNKPILKWIHKIMQELNTEIACIRLGNINVIPVTSPELAREFLKELDAVFASRPHCMTCEMTSDGYLTTIISPLGDQWKKMKRIIISEVLSPAMHRLLHKKVCLEEADHLVKYVYNQCQSPLKDGLVNVRAVARHYCGSVTKKIIFGKRFFGAEMEDGGPGMQDEEHMDALFTTVFHVYAFAIADYVPWLEVFDLDGYKKTLKNSIKSMRKYQDPEIDKRVEMWEQGIRKTKEDILDVFINLKDSSNDPLLSVQEIKAQINELMFAAVDNPSNAVEWALAEMINQPDVLHKAYKELDKVVGWDRLVDESDLPKLNYVKACIKEAFRMHPVNPFNVPHVSTKDMVVGGYFIPKGSHVILSRPGLGKNPRVWEDPLKYKPERHIVNESIEVSFVDHELKMFSFSTGRRGCPGVVLGSTMVTLILARLLQGFNWSAPLNGPGIDLVQSERNMLMAKPLIAHASPRLEPHIYAN